MSVRVYLYYIYSKRAHAAVYTNQDNGARARRVLARLYYTPKLRGERVVLALAPGAFFTARMGAFIVPVGLFFFSSFFLAAFPLSFFIDATLSAASERVCVINLCNKKGVYEA